MQDNVTGKAMIDPDVPSHGSGISEGNAPGSYERQAGYLPDRRSTSMRSTDIDPKAHAAISPTMSKISLL
jgi:hypothetical protein